METVKTEFSNIAKKKIDFLSDKGGEIVRVAVIIRMPDGGECAVDKFGRCNWITPHSEAKVEKTINTFEEFCESLKENPINITLTDKQVESLKGGKK